MGTLDVMLTCFTGQQKKTTTTIKDDGSVCGHLWYISIGKPCEVGNRVLYVMYASFVLALISLLLCYVSHEERSKLKKNYSVVAFGERVAP